MYLSQKQTKMPANYNNWMIRDLWQLQEAVCLLLGIEPDKKLLLYRDRDEYIETDFWKQFDWIAETARTSIDCGKLEVFIYEPNYLFHQLHPSLFLKWAMNKSIKIPKTLSSLIDAEIQSQPDLLTTQTNENRTNNKKYQTNSTSQEPKQTRTNALHEVIKRYFTKLCNEQRKVPQAREVWLALRHDAENIEEIEKIAGWHEKDAKIIWGDSNGKNREMKVSSFQNVITMLRKH